MRYLFFVRLILIASVASSLTSCGRTESAEVVSESGQADANFMPNKYKEGFEKARKSIDAFYSDLRLALDLKNDRKFPEAIQLIQKLIPHARFKNEQLMLYAELADIYKMTGEIGNELKYVKLYEENALNDFKKNVYKKRRQELEASIPEGESH